MTKIGLGISVKLHFEFKQLNSLLLSTLLPVNHIMDERERYCDGFNTEKKSKAHLREKCNLTEMRELDG